MARTELVERIESTPFVDTHEHLLEETTRLAGPGAHALQPCTDAALLFCHYAKDDVWSAGMSAEEQARFFSPDVDPADKWPIVAPYWQRARFTGYLHAVSETLRIVFGVEELSANAFVRVTEAMRAAAQPGFYR